MKNKSIWIDKSNLDKENNDKINFNEIDVDILIIGAGMTGLNMAYFLRNSDKKIVIIDKSKVGMGVSSKTTAKITYLQQDIYRKLTSMHNKNIAFKYYQSQKDAIKLINKIVKDNNIDCDLEKVSSVLFTNKEGNIYKLEKEKEILSSYGERVSEYHDEFVKSGFVVHNTYVFNPLKYIQSLKKIVSKKVTIYEDAIATDIEHINDKYIVHTNNGIIKANTVILACHYPFFVIPNLFPFKTHIEREYVNAMIVDNPRDMTMINIDNDLYSVRYYQDYLIYGSNSHRLTSKIDYYNNYMKSRDDFLKYFNKKPRYSWMNQDIYSNDLLPFIGKIKDNLYISSAYNTWGMTNSIIGARIVCDLILSGDSKYASLFNPRRCNFPLVINSFIGVFHYLKVYIEGLFRKSNPYYVKIDGIIYGVYIDKEGKRHKVKLICPHMKCSLVFNREENTWDCPCHGSRFDIDGNIIETPSVKKIS